MQKDFDGWNEFKKLVQSRDLPFYHEREVWWCALGTNVGFEEDGTGSNFDRPVLIIRGFSRGSLLAIALTGSKKTGKHFFY